MHHGQVTESTNSNKPSTIYLEIALLIYAYKNNSKVLLSYTDCITNLEFSLVVSSLTF